MFKYVCSVCCCCGQFIPCWKLHRHHSTMWPKKLDQSDLTRSSWRWRAFYIATRYSFKFLNFKSTRRWCQIKEEHTHTPLRCDVSCETAIYIWQWALRFDLFAPYYVHEIKVASFVRSSGEAGTIVRFPANHHVCVCWSIAKHHSATCCGRIFISSIRLE